MFLVKINRELCKGCCLCVEFCPRKVLVMDTRLNKRGVIPARFEEGPGRKCTGCGNCAVMCPDAAIEIEETSGAAAPACASGNPKKE